MRRVGSIDRRAGRLVEIRIASPVSPEETVPWGHAHDALVGALRGPYVCFVDLVTMKNEPRLLRTGTLLDASPTFGLQIQRMIREANNLARRAFRVPRELYDWLSEVLEPVERDRLRELLAPRGMTR